MEKEADERWGRQLGQGGHPGRCAAKHLAACCTTLESCAAIFTFQSASVQIIRAFAITLSALKCTCPTTCRTEWEVLDLQDVVVHVFTAEQREFFDLETFYGAAEEVELPFVSDTVEQETAGDLAWAQRL